MISEALEARPAKIGFRVEVRRERSAATTQIIGFAVERAKEGNPEALRFLYVRYSNNVYGYVRSIIHDDHEAEDVTQHVFAKLMTAIGKYDSRSGPFFSWLLRLARNAAIDHLRSNRSTPTETVVDPDASSSPDLDRIDSVKAALASLPDGQREVVVLRHVVGLTPGEIAVRMGRSTSSIHSLYHRGRRALRTELVRLDSAPYTLRHRAA